MGQERGLAAMPGQYHPAQGDQVQGGGAQPVGHGHDSTAVAGAHRVPVTAKRHQPLGADRRLDGHDRRIRAGRDRAQPLGGGQIGHPASGAVFAAPGPGVADSGAEPVQGGLGLGRGQLIGQGAPPALRGTVVGLLDHPFAVAPPRGANRDGYSIVRGHRAKRGR